MYDILEKIYLLHLFEDVGHNMNKSVCLVNFLCCVVFLSKHKLMLLLSITYNKHNSCYISYTLPYVG